MMIPKQYQAIEDFERYLGDPANPDNPFSTRRVMQLDEQEEYPQELLDTINGWGAACYHVPQSYGGKLVSLEQSLSLARSVARRDITVGVANGVCLLGALPVWFSGSEEQKQRVAELLLTHCKLGFALSERERGHDILSNDTSATLDESDYILNGEKWTIGHATRSDALTLYARTAPNGGARGYTMFLLDKRLLHPDDYAYVPKLKTLGLRAHDLSGIRLDQLRLPASAKIGAEGDGLLLATQATLVTRTLCAAIMLGGTDTALRMTVDFALNRQLYGKPLYEMEHIRATLADVLVDLLISDCLATSTARAWHMITDQMSIWASAVKYFVPTVLEESVHQLASVLGSRFFLRDDYAEGLFQKIYRDIPIVSVFEGSSNAQLHGVALQLRQLLRQRPSSQESLADRLRRTFCYHESIDEFVQPDKIELHSHGQNDALEGIEHSLTLLMDRSHPLQERVAVLVQSLRAQLAQLRSDYASCSSQLRDKSLMQLEFSQHYIRLHTAAVCFHTWVYNLDQLDDFFHAGEWLEAALSKLLHPEQRMSSRMTPKLLDTLGQQLVNRLKNNTAYSIVPIQYGSS